MRLILNNINVILNKKPILKDINLEFESRKLYVLIGSNGIGKTTLLRTISGYYKILNGNIECTNDLIRQPFNFDYCRYLSHNCKFVEFLTVHENIELILQINGGTVSENNINYYLERYSLSGKKYKMIRNLSSGEQKKVGLVCQLLIHAPVILFDEPFNSIDENAAIFFAKDLYELSKERLVIIAEHNLDYLNKEKIVMINMNLINRLV